MEIIRNMVKKLLLLLLVVSLFLVCGGCNGFDDTMTKCGDELFYDPYMQKIIKYNSKTKKLFIFNSGKNQFQYRISNEEDLYIDGNSLENEFRIIQLNKNSITEIHKFKKNQGIFPIGKIGEKLYFIHSYYMENGQEKNEKRTLGVFDFKTKKIDDFLNVSGLIDYGGVNREYIYYTVYNDENDTYSLMKINNNNKYNMPELVKKYIVDGIVLVKNDKFYYSDGDNLIYKKEMYKKESVNFLEKDSLFQFYINIDGQLCIRITNLKNNNIIEEENISGIKFENNNIVICKLTGVIMYEL